MYELTHKDGFKVLVEYKEGLGWYDLEGYKLREDCWIWYEPIYTVYGNDSSFQYYAKGKSIEIIG